MSVRHSFEFTIFCTALASLLSLQATNAQQPGQFITSLSRRISARTLLFYCDADNILCNRLIKQLKTPRLRITTNSTVTLQDYYHADILAVVVLERNSALEEQNLKGLLSTLLESQHTHILFMTKKEALVLATNTAPQTTKLLLGEWRWLFDWCWSNGFINVLVLESWQNANRTAVELVTYKPFPTLSIHYTTLSSYLRARKRTANFQGATIRAGVGHNPPRSLLYQNNQGKHVYRGIVPEFLRLFAWRYNATLEFVVVKVPANKTFSPKYCINMLAERKLDLCADSYVGNNAISISRPIFISMGYLLVRYPQPIPRYRYFFTPFSLEVWLLLLATFLFIFAVTAIISRLQYGIWDFEYFFLEVFGSFLQIPCKLCLIHGHVNPFLCLLLTVCGFVISSIYLTCLSSILTTDIYEREIESIEDLHRLNISVLVGDTDIQVLKYFGIPKIVEELFEIMPWIQILAIRETLDPHYAQLMFFDKCQMHLYRQRFLLRPRAKLLDTPVEASIGGVPMKKNWPFKDLLDMHMLHFLDYGFFWHVLAESLEESLQHGNLSTFPTEGREVAALNLVYFEMPALLLGSGYTMALLAFIGEQMIHWIYN